MSTDFQLLTLEGEFDIHSAARFEALLRPTIDVPHVIVDFSKVRYFDSTAIGILISIRKARAKRGFGPKRFVGLNAPMRKVMKMTGLDAIWPPYDDIASAAASF